MYTSPNYSENYECYRDFKLQEKLRQSAEALRILDRNTVLYMLEEQEKELKEQADKIKEQAEKLEEQAEMLAQLQNIKVKTYISACREFDLDKHATALKLAAKFHLSPETAQERVTQYWGN